MMPVVIANTVMVNIELVNSVEENYSILPTAKKVVKVYTQGPKKALSQQSHFKQMSSKFDTAFAKISQSCLDKNITMSENCSGFTFNTICITNFSLTPVWCFHRRFHAVLYVQLLRSLTLLTSLVPYKKST